SGLERAVIGSVVAHVEARAADDRDVRKLPAVQAPALVLGKYPDWVGPAISTCLEKGLPLKSQFGHQVGISGGSIVPKPRRREFLDVRSVSHVREHHGS